MFESVVVEVDDVQHVSALDHPPTGESREWTEFEIRLDELLRNSAVRVGASRLPCAALGVQVESATCDPARLSDAGLIDALVALHRQAASVQARQAWVLAEFARRRPDQDGGLFDPYGVDEVALAWTLSAGTAHMRVGQAVRLDNELAATRQAWAAGLVDERKVTAICQATQHLDREVATAVQDRVLPDAPRQTLAQLWAALRRAVLAADPEGANERYRRAVKGRRVDLYPEDDGMAMLPAQDALSCYRWLTRLALGMTGDPRSMDQRRADLLVTYLSGQLGTIPEQDRADTTDRVVDDPAAGADRATAVHDPAVGRDDVSAGSSAGAGSAAAADASAVDDVPVGAPAGRGAADH